MKNFYRILREAKTRILTALLLLISISILAFINNLFLVWLVLGGLFILSLLESFRLFETKEPKLLYLGIFAWLMLPFVGDALVFLCVILLAMLTKMLIKNSIEYKNFLPLLYPGISFFLWFELYVHFGMFALLWLIFIIAPVDIGAYFVGKSIGKTPFSPISPNKTMQGSFGGVALGSIIGTCFGLIEYGFLSSLIVSFLVSLISIYGDLFESYLKRKVDLKDSGNILPGHGGILDRVDGYLFGVVVMYFLLIGM